MEPRDPSWLHTVLHDGPGALLGEYRASPLRIVLGLTGVLSLLTGLFISFILGYALLNPSDNPSDNQNGLVAGFIMVVFFFVGAAYCFWTFHAQRGSRARLYERALIISGGGQTNVIEWGAITSVTQPRTWMTATGVPAQRFRVTLFTGKTIEINEAFSRVAHLGDAIQRMSANALLPGAVAAFHSGASVPFGPISLSQAGISKGRETLPWSEFNHVTTGGGYLFIFGNGNRSRWATLPAAKVANLYVLTALLDHIQRGAR